jgi:hypothetical protein
LTVQGARAIVTVLWGPLAGRKAILSPGASLSIGRAELADLVVPQDAAIAARHVVLDWDGERCRYRDLDTPNGTNHNGEERRREGELAHRDWLKLGDTVFTFHIEAHTPPRRVTLSEVETERRARAEAALAELSAIAERDPLYAVLDMARDKRILTLCRESVEEHVSLYDGLAGENLAAVAPHMVRLAPGSRLLASLLHEGFQKRWGIWLTSRAQVREVRRQLRRFLMVEIEDRPRRVYFRFYDPGTLVSILPTLSPRQAEDFYGETIAFYAEHRGGELRRFPRPASPNMTRGHHA